MRNKIYHCESLTYDSKEDDLKEVKRAWELGKKIDFSSSNEIDVIWAMAKNRRINKGKKNTNSRNSKHGQKDKKAKD